MQSWHHKRTSLPPSPPVSLSHEWWNICKQSSSSSTSSSSNTSRLVLVVHWWCHKWVALSCVGNKCLIFCAYKAQWERQRADMFIKLYSWRNEVYSASCKWYKIVKGFKLLFHGFTQKKSRRVVSRLYTVCMFFISLYSSRHSLVSVALLAVLVELEIRGTYGFTWYYFTVMSTVYSCNTGIILKYCPVISSVGRIFAITTQSCLPRKSSTIGTSIPITHIISYHSRAPNHHILATGH